MKKNIVYAFMVAMALILSACGSNDKVDYTLSDVGNDVIEVKAGNFTITNLSFETIIPFVKSADADVVIELTDFNFAATGCVINSIDYTPNPLILDGSKGSQKSLTISGTVASDCNATAYTLIGDQKISLGNENETSTDVLFISTTLDTDGNPGAVIDVTDPLVPGAGDGEYIFFDPPSSLTITKPSTVYNIAVQLVDSDAKGVVGETVYIQAYAPTDTLGKITNLSVVTDQNGYANFEYTSPTTLINGQLVPLEVVYEDENGTKLITNITLTHSTSATTPNTYNFINADSITVTSATEEQEITVTLVDSSNVGVSGKEVKVTTLPSAFGALSPSSVKTDDSGKATFNYTPPSDLTSVNGQSENVSLIFTDENDNTITATSTITIQSSTVVGANYSLVNETTPITITRADQVEIISVNVVDALNVGVAGKNVTLTNPAFGSLTSATAVTNAAGLAEFTYQAPSDLTSLVTTAMTLRFEEDGVTVTKNVTVNVNTTVVTSDYILGNANDVTINYATQSAEIGVQVTKNGAPVAGESVTAKSIPAAFGRVENATVVTGTDGYARFNYIAADVLTDGTQPLELVHTDANGAEAAATVDIIVLAKPLYQFANESNLTIEKPDTQIDLKAQLLFEGVPIVNKTVVMEGFDAKYGSIFNYQVQTDNGGYATFAYTAPDATGFDEVNGTTQIFKIKFIEGVIVEETNLTINFSETLDSIDGNVSLPIVVIPTTQREVILDSNSKTVEIAIKVFKDIAPYALGSVKVELPEKVLNGVDVGQFASYEVAVDAQGVATFSYTGPSNLQALITNDDNESIFKFYHVDNSEDKQEMKVLYQLPADDFISRNYELEIVTSGEFSMGIPDKEKTFNVLLKAKDSAGNDVVLTDENITKITALTTNSTIAQILDTATGTLVNSLELNAVNNSPFILKSKQLSGLVPVQVTVDFADANGDPQSLTTIVNVRVFSGPASAISISYVSTGQDTARAKYIETLAISVTDEYGNRVNTRPNITLGAIVGYAVDGSEASSNESNETKRLFYGRSDIESGNADGEIIQLGANTATFEDNTPARTDVFQYVNAEGNNTDKLVVFGEQKNYEAMGKWDITSINTNTLSLQDEYYGIDRSGLYYAVGHNYYQDLCREDGREWVGSTDSETYQLDDEGTVTVTYKYDYHLTGKDALIWVNLDGIQPDTGAITRVGETVKHTLRGTGFRHVPSTGYTLKKGVSGVTVVFDIWHETAPERYRNGHFGWRIKEGSNCSIDKDITGNSIIFTSNDYDARSCIRGDGQAFVAMQISNPDPDADCTFDITGEVVTSEF